MKNYRLLLAAAVALSAAGCSGDVTAPDPAVRAGGAPASGNAAPEPVVVSPAEEPTDNSAGQGGSGCCAKG
ncbi:MAG TPA: hypothetical protein VGC13_23765 [Longimicrobium sp.]|jgi:hypothetical protein|uniref:hypothetical protein n=1 Tax=Longimicrobium sp. TaxID=2029185 RepID=UPI002ED8B290